ncbi:MAG: DUF2628 domain-containing protein [Emcibacteraceae bacterium]|nr:DUF2628 domain-containing protein [Emcibacteraceae bacterium]
MKSFKVYEHPTLGYKAIKTGFSWPAFFFQYFWLFYSKLWWYSFLIFGSFSCLAAIEGMIMIGQPAGFAIAHFIIVIGYFLVWLVPAFKGNGWLEKNSIDKGFIFISSVDAKTKEAAISGFANKTNNSNEESDKYYEMAFEELSSNNVDKGTWARAYSESSDEESAKRIYIKYRVEKLSKEVEEQAKEGAISAEARHWLEALQKLGVNHHIESSGWLVIDKQGTTMKITSLSKLRDYARNKGVEPYYLKSR